MKTSQIITAKMRTKSFASQLRRAFRFTVLPHGFRKNIIATRNDRNIQILPILWHGKTFIASQWFIGFSQLTLWGTWNSEGLCEGKSWTRQQNLGQTKKRSWAAALNLGLCDIMCKKDRKGRCNAGNAWREYRIMYIIYNSITWIQNTCCLLSPWWHEPARTEM